MSIFASRYFMALFEQIGLDAAVAARRADEAITLLRGRADPTALAQPLMDKFIADAVLGRGADAALLDEALTLEADAGGQPLAYPLVWYHWIDDLDAARSRFRIQLRRHRDHGDVARPGGARGVRRDGRVSRRELGRRGAGPGGGVLDTRAVRAPRAVDRVVRRSIDHRRPSGAVPARSRHARGHPGWGPGSTPSGGWSATRRSAPSSSAPATMAPPTQLGRPCATEARPTSGSTTWRTAASPITSRRCSRSAGRTTLARMLERLEWRGRTLPRPWIDAGLPRARALVLAPMAA